MLELLIVIVIIGIMGSLVTLSMRSGTQGDQQRQEAERIVALFNLATQEAVVRGMPMALECNRHGYRFLHLTDGEWHTETEDAIFRERALPAQMALSLMLDKQPLALIETTVGTTKPDPQIVFTPDGDMGLFDITLTLKDSEASFTVSNTAKDGLIMTAHSTAQP
ncbi:MAG: type II secretion system minor pseudopilin GspH [Methylovulum miyakonense]|uniref:type II secretion system minor pseudopilin GspH n=1 Tax=Methylovulum miyakonense TaxID=645578 RepID=UPI003BB50917